MLLLQLQPILVVVPRTRTLSGHTRKTLLFILYLSVIALALVSELWPEHLCIICVLFSLSICLSVLTKRWQFFPDRQARWMKVVVFGCQRSIPRFWSSSFLLILSSETTILHPFQIRRLCDAFYSDTPVCQSHFFQSYKTTHIGHRHSDDIKVT